MNPQVALSPPSLRYIAALRGHKPNKTGTEFAYAEAACTDPERLTCLAASNPEGRFYGFVADDTARRGAEEIAARRGTFNVVFLAGSPSVMAQRIAKGSSLPPMLDFLCCDESATPLSETERKALFDLAKTRLNPSGMLVSTYRACDRDDGSLRFVIRELAPEMDAGQQQDFLVEIKKLASIYLGQHPDLADALDKAIADRKPKDFFALFDDAPAASKTFDTVVASAERGFIYGGDSRVESNFVELAVPYEAQDLVVSCRNSPLYEPIKDLALNRTIRSDIWVQTPCDTSLNPVELFGGFAYGLLVSREKIPSSFAAKGKKIDLSSPLYTKVLDLMAIMPIGVGDVLAHDSGQGEDPRQILEVFQILVACGLASPMRGLLKSMQNDTVTQPQLVGSFNRYLDKTSLTDKDVLFASQVAGCGVLLSAREAFVMQALNRVGLNNSVGALLPELQRLANTPMALPVIRAEVPTDEIAHAMVLDVVQESLPQWYAYAILEAA